MDEGDGVVAASTGRIGLAVERDRAGIGLVDAREDLDEGRFAGAVFAEQRDDLAAREFEADALEGLRAAERLDDGVETQRAAGRHRRTP